LSQTRSSTDIGKSGMQYFPNTGIMAALVRT
jgi:hypothetical protein